MTIFRKGELLYPGFGQVSDEQLLCALRYIRTEPHRASVLMIANSVSLKIWNVPPLIDKLINLEYIRQDSRDNVDPYNPGATYYTVPRKREEIDRLLKDDEKK